ERAKERGFAGAAPAQDGHELTGADDEVDPMQSDRRGRADDAEPGDLDHGGECSHGGGYGGAQRGRTPSSPIAARPRAEARATGRAQPAAPRSRLGGARG